MPKFNLVFIVITLEIVISLSTIQEITVAKDGSGDFRTVSSAVNSISSKNTKTIIKIKPGIYFERVHITQVKNQVIFLGQDASSTLIIFDTPGSQVGTFSSWTVLVEADDFIAEKISFANNASNYNHTVAGQSVALDIRGDRATIRDCNLFGAQDTLYTGKLRNYFQNCFVNGSVDSIFGEGSSVFENCTLEITGYVTAHKGSANHTKYLLLNSSIRPPSNRPYINQGTYLGRPWGCLAWVIYKQCYIGNLISPIGWDDWKKPLSCLATVNFDEWRSYGPGSAPNSRVKWSHQLTDNEAAQYTVETVLDGWVPPSPISDGIFGM